MALGNPSRHQLSLCELFFLAHLRDDGESGCRHQYHQLVWVCVGLQQLVDDGALVLHEQPGLLGTRKYVFAAGATHPEPHLMELAHGCLGLKTTTAISRLNSWRSKGPGQRVFDHMVHGLVASGAIRVERVKHLVLLHKDIYPPLDSELLKHVRDRVRAVAASSYVNDRQVRSVIALSWCASKAGRLANGTIAEQAKAAGKQLEKTYHIARAMEQVIRNEQSSS